MAVHLSVIDRSGSVEFAGAGRLPSSNIHRVDSCARTHAHGHSLAPVSAPVGFVARGFVGILYPLPSLRSTEEKLLSEANLLTTYEDEKVLEKPAATVVAKPSWLFLLCMVQSFMLLVLIFYIVKRGKNCL